MKKIEVEAGWQIFKNGKTMSAFCRMRYGQSKSIWDDKDLWAYVKEVSDYAVKLNVAEADKKFNGSDEKMQIAKEKIAADAKGREAKASAKGTSAEDELEWTIA